MKRICPSDIFNARSKTCRHAVGLRKGNKPSNTNISANAPITQSSMVARQLAQRLASGAATTGPAPPPAPRIALKNSLDGSTTITSLLLRKLAR